MEERNFRVKKRCKKKKKLKLYKIPLVANRITIIYRYDI
jgi:hypothetical protein